MKYTPILADKITKKALKELKNEQELHIIHPQIKGLIIKIYYYSFQDTVFGIPTTFYETHVTIKDNADTIHQKHNLKLEIDEVYEYMQDFLTATSKMEFLFNRALKERGLSLGDIIEFHDGKRAVITSFPEDNPYPRMLYYVPLKKDGTMSKHKPRLLYGNLSYTVINKENI